MLLAASKSESPALLTHTPYLSETREVSKARTAASGQQPAGAPNHDHPRGRMATRVHDQRREPLPRPFGQSAGKWP